MKTIIGSIVFCRLFNKPEEKFYGKEFKGKIIAIDYDHFVGEHNRPYHVDRMDIDLPPIWLSGKEVLRKAREG